MTSPSQVNTSEEATHPRLGSELTAELGRLYSAGFSLLPLGGDDGKKPIVSFRDRDRLPLGLVLDKMGGGGSSSFGIRLTGMLVVDVDTDTPEARAYVEARFGTSPTRTKTSRGYHLFFQHQGPKPTPVRERGILVDFKSGPNEFVVGALSVRPDGVVYRAEGRLLAREALPHFRDNQPYAEEQAQDRRIDKGSRHRALLRVAVKAAERAHSLDDLVAELSRIRDTQFESAEDFEDDEVRSIADWSWNRRVAGQLWSGASSTVAIKRFAIRELARRNLGLASLIYLTVMAEHGHTDRPFAIVPDALKRSGRLKAGRRQIYEAIDELIEIGLLILVSIPRGNRDCRLYRIGRAECVGEQGEGSSLILVSDSDTHSGHPLRREDAA